MLAVVDECSVKREEGNGINVQHAGYGSFEIFSLRNRGGNEISIVQSVGFSLDLA